MSNVELTREFWRLWQDDGFAELLSRYDDFFTEDLKWHSPLASVAGRQYVGRAAFERHLADLTDSFATIAATPRAIVELAPDAVRSDVRVYGKGTTSGAGIDAPLISLARLRGGRIHWVWASFDLAAAERTAAAIARGEEVAI